MEPRSSVVTEVVLELGVEVGLGQFCWGGGDSGEGSSDGDGCTGNICDDEGGEADGAGGGWWGWGGGGGGHTVGPQMELDAGDGGRLLATTL